MQYVIPVRLKILYDDYVPTSSYISDYMYIYLDIYILRLPSDDVQHDLQL